METIFDPSLPYAWQTSEVPGTLALSTLMSINLRLTAFDPKRTHSKSFRYTQWMIFEPTRHIPVERSPWNPLSAAAYIEETFERTERAVAIASPDQTRLPLYDGIAGVGWAQHRLHKMGFGDMTVDYLPLVEQAREKQAKNLRDHDAVSKALLVGELGFRLTEHNLAPDDHLLVSLVRVIEANEYNPACELLSGSPGSILVACSLIDDVPSLQSFIRRAVDQLEAQLCFSTLGDYRVWMTRAPSGRFYDLLGMAHGFAGNSLSIIRAFPYLSDAAVSNWAETITRTFKRTASREGNLANWPVGIDGKFLVQQCHGAPGIICCVGELMNRGDDEFDRLILDAGELIWQAGALEKGSNFCHGTAGNGYAFLKLFRATEDQLWLDRARAFAVTAISQSKEARKKEGSGQPSLWTGDLGLCFYLESCIEQTAAIPTLDYF